MRQRLRINCIRSYLHFTLSFFSGLIFLTTVMIGSAAANTKEYELQQKMADISLLKNQLTNQKSKVIDLREKLYSQKDELINEIFSETKRLRIKSFKSTHRSTRIRYNLELIRELEAYINSFNDKIRYYEIGSDKLSYLHNQADDELRIVQTLSDMKIDALFSQIELVLEQYMPEAHSIIINPDDFVLESQEDIWVKLSKKK